MSAGTPGQREVAHRVFAAEFDDSTFSYSESDEERAPNYVITPTGARVNRLFVVGVLTEVERVNDDVVRARVVDPTGAFVVYASQYQPEALAVLERTDPPSFVAVTGKANTFQPDGSDRIFTSVRPESVNEVDAHTRDRWTVQTASNTLERVSRFADARSRADEDGELPVGIKLALEQYGTTPAYLASMRDLALDAARLVAGELDAVEPPTLQPGDAGRDDVSLDELRTVDSSGEPAATDAPGVATGTAVESAEAETTATSGSSTASSSAETETTTGSTTGSSEPDVTTATASTTAGDSDADAAADSTLDAEPAGGASVDDGTAIGDTAGSDDDADDGADVLDDADSIDADEVADDGTGDVTDDGDPVDGDDALDFDEDVLDEAERAEVEETYGTEFTTGADVGEPGEAGIDVPDIDELEEELAANDDLDASTAETDVESDAVTETATDDGETDKESMTSDGTRGDDSAGDDVDEQETPAEPVDLESAVVEAMRELDDGDGAERDAVIEAVSGEHGVDHDDVQDAIQGALMGGRCYEPADDLLKPI